MNLKPREKWMAGVAVLVGVVMGFDQFVTLPKKNELDALQKQMAEYNQKLGTVTASLAGLKIVKKRVEEKQKEKAWAVNRVTDESQVGLLLDHIGKEGQKQQVNLTQLTINEDPSGPTAEKKEGAKPKNFKKLSIEVGLLTGYESIGPFLDSLQSLPIFSDFDRIEISRKDESFPKLQVTFAEGLYISTQASKGERVKADGR
jgi:hypothetical protein